MVTVNAVLSDADGRMKKAIEALSRELVTIRTGRSNPALVEHLLVEYYGTPTPLNQIASITAPDARMLIIQPWDKGVIGMIEKAILRSELGLTPNNDGAVVRLTLPPLTEERRHELARMVSKRTEDARIAVRSIRRDAIDKFRTSEREKEMSQDESRRAQEQVQKLTEALVAQVDAIGKAKEREVLGAA
ncbi:MAG: ribosome recycling factor [Dehalococcoidia bacterium]|nr:ribosome recycling factor [Dehalococcoidia bacterium]